MRFGSLFSGIGGLDLGLERAGHACAFQVERDPDCQKVLRRHWPDIPLYSDIREVDPRDLPPIELLAGGFPCQPHSSAGKRRGADDERDMWPEFARIIAGTRPRWVVAENVDKVRTTAGGEYFAGVLADLAALGFDADWQVLSAAAHGARHLRRRIVIVAHAHDDGSQVEPERDAATPRGDQEQQLGRDADGLRDGGARGGLVAWRVPDQREGPAPEPGVGRVVDGASARLDPAWRPRIRQLGNAVYPPWAEHIGRLIPVR